MTVEPLNEPVSGLGDIPDDEVVAIAWIETIPGLVLDGVSTELPDDIDISPRQGYIMVTQVGGGMGSDFPIHTAVLQCDCYVLNPDDDRVHDLSTKRIANKLREACFDRKNMQRALHPHAIGPDSMNIQYPLAKVFGAYAATFPHKIATPPDDQYSGHSVDITMTWVWNTTYS
jgi:hypothetical protein